MVMLTSEEFLKLARVCGLGGGRLSVWSIDARSSNFSSLGRSYALGSDEIAGLSPLEDSGNRGVLGKSSRNKVKELAHRRDFMYY